MQIAIVSSQLQEMLRRIILLGTPLILGVLELGHPLLDRVNPIKTLAPITPHLKPPQEDLLADLVRMEELWYPSHS